MKQIVWLTDLHLNFVPRDDVVLFLLRVAKLHADAILLSGDIGESTDVCGYLDQMARAWKCPIYFVLGNHDYYFGSIAGVRDQVRQLCQQQTHLHFLTDEPIAEMAPGIGLIGHDGWADGRYGDYIRSYVRMNDYRLIAELTGLDKLHRWDALKQLGDAAADAVRERLIAALGRYDHVYLVTHVPPLWEACWHEGRLSDEQWSPHFTCKAVGDVILEVMLKYPDKQLTVLCGHTHGSGIAQPLDNLVIHTGGAEYGRPAIAQVIEV